MLSENGKIAIIASAVWVASVALMIVTGFLIYWFALRDRPRRRPQVRRVSGHNGVIQNGNGHNRELERNGSMKEEEGFVHRMRKGSKNVAIFYGSQSGMAEEMANRLARNCSRFNLNGIALDPEECNMVDLVHLQQIKDTLALFCMATYGDGDPTDNSKEFYDVLKKGTINLKGLRYAVFGLGNATYGNYNAMGKFTDQRLAELGATRVYDLGLGNDSENLEEDFVVWCDGLWQHLSKQFNLRENIQEVTQRQYQLTVHSNPTDNMKVYTGEVGRINSYKAQKPPYNAKNPFLAAVLANKELHTGGSRSCMHIELDLTGSRLRYEAGDHVGIYPSNDVDLVEKLGIALGVNLETVISLRSVDEDDGKLYPFPCPCSYRTAFLYYVDVTSPPRTHILKSLSEHCLKVEDAEFLKSLTTASADSRKLYSEWILNCRRTILDLLTDIETLRPPIDLLLEILPRLQPRYYSISSSPKVNPNVLSITAVRTEYRTRLGRLMKGVATTWLGLQTPGPEKKVPIFVRKSRFHLPPQPTVPCIMVGPGTGIAPLRGFIQDRLVQQKEGKTLGPAVLYFGCRRHSEDFLYEAELQGFTNDRSLSKLYVAFSREQPYKIYVQDLMRQRAEELWELLKQGGHIYVCGDAKNMAKEVHKVITETVAVEGNLSAADANEFVKNLEKQKRYHVDVWS